jgi:ABC-type Mn2+/Zn2+ transport system ATPase subunit
VNLPHEPTESVRLQKLVQPVAPTTAADAPWPEATQPAARKPIVAADGVTLAYGRKPILQNVNLQIHESEFWCFIGPNGEGKTTLLRALLGALRPSRGRVYLRPDFARRTRVGFVPQECDLNLALPTTVREFILTGTAGLPLDGAMRQSRLARVLEVMGLQRVRVRNFWNLSGGQRQRAMVARALVRDPLLLVVDEPTAGLDMAAATGLLEIITDLNRAKGITVVFVTHDLNLAAQRASHIALFRQGIVRAGPLAEIFTSENLSQTFGVPIEARRDEAGQLSIHSLPLPAAA